VHVLHIDLGREMRGGQFQILMLMRGLREAGYTQELLVRSAAPLSHLARDSGFAVASARPQAVLASSGVADVVHAHDAHSHSLAALFSRSTFVVSRRVAFPVGRGFPSRWKYGRARRYLAVSKFVAGQLERAGVDRAKIDVVYDGVTTLPSRIDSARPRTNVVALESKDPLKCRDLITKAAGIAGLPVVFSSDLTRDLQSATVFLYVTKSEGFGSAALLAMSLGVPVVASRVGGLPEIVQHEASGLLVSNDPEEIAAAVLRLRSDTNLALALARNGRARVEREFSDSRMVESTMESYRRALSA